MLTIMKAGNNGGLNREWLSVTLGYFHGLPRKVGKMVTTDKIVDVVNGGVTID